MIAINRNESDHRYEATVEGGLAGFAAYDLDERTVIFTHTVVQTEFEGRGVGSALAKYALEHSRSRSRTVVPVCEFIAAYIGRHPEYQDLLGAQS